MPPAIRPNRPQLLTYPDSLGGTIGDVTALLRGPLAGRFSSVHVLPPFPSSGDKNAIRTAPSRSFPEANEDRLNPCSRTQSSWFIEPSGIFTPQA